MKRNVYYGNRGKKLEVMIDMTNNLLRNKGVADIRKIPTPVKILKRTGSRITGALDTPTWVDYCGIFKGNTIIFDAKETNSTNFPLSNLKNHQYELLKSWHEKGAYAFILVAFWTNKNESDAYIVPFSILQKTWETKLQGGRKSISLKMFETECIKVKSRSGYPLDYITEIEKAILTSDW